MGLDRLNIRYESPAIIAVFPKNPVPGIVRACLMPRLAAGAVGFPCSGALPSPRVPAPEPLSIALLLPVLGTLRTVEGVVVSVVWLTAEDT